MVIRLFFPPVYRRGKPHAARVQRLAYRTRYRPFASTATSAALISCLTADVETESQPASLKGAPPAAIVQTRQLDPQSIWRHLRARHLIDSNKESNTMAFGCGNNVEDDQG